MTIKYNKDRVAFQLSVEGDFKHGIFVAVNSAEKTEYYIELDNTCVGFFPERAPNISDYADFIGRLESGHNVLLNFHTSND